MTDKIFASYDLDSGTAAARPATPTVSDGRLYVYAATDTHVISVWDGSAWVSFTGSPTVNTLPTRQTLTSGTAATYTTPAGCRQLRVLMYGGGGGGSGSGTTGGNDGGTGTKSTFNSIDAAPGIGAGNGTGGLGGTAGSGSAMRRVNGANGFPGFYFADSATTANYFGGHGAEPGGGRGAETFNQTAGASAQANTGGGGGGGSTNTVAFATLFVTWVGSGGGHGEKVELIINSPAGIYTYTVGAAGAAGNAGTGGAAGGLGGTGVIIVDEYY